MMYDELGRGVMSGTFIDALDIDNHNNNDDDEYDDELCTRQNNNNNIF